MARPSSSDPPASPRKANSPSHVPLTPNRLRETIAMSSDANIAEDDSDVETTDYARPSNTSSQSRLDTRPKAQNNLDTGSSSAAATSNHEANEITELLQHYHNNRVCGRRNCNHGTFSPRAPSMASTEGEPLDNASIRELERILSLHEADDTPSEMGSSFLGEQVGEADDGAKTITKMRWLSRSSGGKYSNWVYFSYYFPFARWIIQYKWEYFRGDLAAAITMSSFYIPMSLSYASNLAHVSPVNGLYAFVFNPLIYALLGSCPQMVVGPEAPGSLLVGTVVAKCIDKGTSHEDNELLNSQIAGVVTGIAGAIIFVAGLTRLGFLDSVLSRPFLRGFISAIGVVIMVDQAIPELGLSDLSQQTPGVQHGSTMAKIVFLLKNLQKSHGLTAAVSLGSFAIIMFFRELKKRMQKNYPSVAYFPDRFLVVLTSAILAYCLHWDDKGLDLLGPVKAEGSSGIPFHWPFQFQHMKHIDTALSTSLLIALLGFFESSVAAKSLGEGTSDLRGMNVSANRELIALGTANIIGGCFMALPAFGGYGRSKVNKSTGGTTPMSSILLSLISLLSVIFLLPYFYYLPKGVLSAMVSVVAYSLVEECPHDIKFFIQIRGWTELALMAIIFFSTIFYSLTVGIALGMGLSLLSIIRHATKPRIQILGRVSGTQAAFENAEFAPENIEYIEGCLIVKIPEPLTFANTGALKNRLKRLEKYGTNKAHPSLPRTRRSEHNRNVIFDVHGVTSIDGSGTQVLTEIVENYVNNGVRVIFCRIPRRRNRVFEAFERSGIVHLCGGEHHFVASVEEALKLSEQEEFAQYSDHVGG